MDPNANLRAQLDLACEILAGRVKTTQIEDKATELAELVVALNDWIRNGGFLPDAFVPVAMRAK